MYKSIRERIDSKIAFIRKAAKGFLKIDKFGKDMKYLYHDIKPTKRKHIPKAVRDAVMERDNYKCVYCASTNNPELDHNEAHTNNGSDEIDNLQVLCRSCNRRKGAS